MLGDMDADAGALVSAAVRQTMHGGAKFRFACRIAVPGYDADAGMSVWWTSIMTAASSISWPTATETRRPH
jgi:hypothetical protein